MRSLRRQVFTMGSHSVSNSSRMSLSMSSSRRELAVYCTHWRQLSSHHAVSMARDSQLVYTTSNPMPGMHHIVSHHITSYYITSHHIASHHIVSYCIASSDKDASSRCDGTMYGETMVWYAASMDDSPCISSKRPALRASSLPASIRGASSQPTDEWMDGWLIDDEDE